MTDFFLTGRNWEHTLAVVLFLARAGDVGSIYLMTPTLRLVTNPIVRKLGWPFVLLTLGLCAVPYYNTAVAMILIAWSLFATASNLSRAWIIRGLGEVECVRILRQAAAGRPLRESIALVLTSSGAFGFAGLVLLGISPGAGRWTWASVFAVGMILYACGMAIFVCVFMRRLHREGRVRVAHLPFRPSDGSVPRHAAQADLKVRLCVFPSSNWWSRASRGSEGRTWTPAQSVFGACVTRSVGALPTRCP